jgi:general secretion pathway protein L
MLILGLDVGTSAVKGVLLRRELFRLVPVKAFSIEIKAPPTAQEIRELVSREAADLEVLVLSLPRDQVITRNLTLPFKDPRKIKLVVPAEAERNLTFPLKDAVLAHVVAEQSSPSQTQILAFAIHRKNLAEWTERLDGAGVAESTLAIDSLGAVNAFLHETEATGAAALVDIGASKTSIEIVHGTRLVYSRSIGVAGDACTHAIATALKIEPAEAEDLKRRLSDDDPPPRRDEAKKAMVEVYRRLIRELKVTLMSARNTWPDLDIEQVLVCGGSARLPGLVQTITDGVDVPTTVLGARSLDPLGAQTQHASFVQAFGLALTGARQSTVDVDLLGRPRNILRYHRREIALSAVILTVLLCWGFLSTRRELASLKSELENANVEITRSLSEIGKLTRNPVELASIDARASQLQKMMTALSEDVTSRLTLLNDIAKAIPERLDVVLINLSIERGTVELEGTTDSFETLQKLEESLKSVLKRPVDVRPPRNEVRDDKSVTVFKLSFPAQPPRDDRGGRS